MRKIFLSLALAIFFNYLLLLPVSAQSFPLEGVTVQCFVSGNIRGINTAIGCIPFENRDALFAFILRWAIGVAGGIALILIIIAGFQITTSAGDPKRLQAGQELLTSAVGGLLLLIFSTFLLRVIGVNILGIF